MNVLVACEYSGIVRDAFENAGWNAWSCDLLPTESEQTKKSKKHIQGDVLKLIEYEKLNEIRRFGSKNHIGRIEHIPVWWDLLIAHPPCTYLTYAGMSNWLDEGRTMKRIESAKFFMQLYEAKIKHICVENPQGIMSKILRNPDQVVHPYYFGDSFMKRTCLWLKELPVLQYRTENDLFGNKTATEKPKPVIEYQRKTGKKKVRYYTDYVFRNYPKEMQSHLRSKFWSGIAKAMAEQWTEYIEIYNIDNQLYKKNN